MKYCLIYIFYIVSWSFSLAQSPLTILQDYHNDNVTQMIVHPSGDYFFTADETGKIIMWNTSDYSFNRTIAQSKKGSPVRAMDFRFSGRGLMVAEGLQGKMFPNSSPSRIRSYEEEDSLAFYPIFEDKVGRKSNLSFDLFPRTNDSMFLSTLFHSNSTFLLGFYDEANEAPLFEYEPSNQILSAVFSEDAKKIGISEFIRETDESKQQSHVSIFDLNKKEVLFEKITNGKVFHMIVAPDYFFTFSHITDKDNQKNIVVSKVFINKDSTVELYSIPCYSTFEPTVQVDKSDKYKVILNSQFDPPVFFEINGTDIVNLKINLPIPANTALAFVPGKNHLIGWAEKHPYYGNNPSFYVYDYEAETIISRYSIPSKNSIEAAYLPGDNWMVSGMEIYEDKMGYASPQRLFLKYFEKGTLNNRFGRLNFRDYLKQNHNVDILDVQNFYIDKDSAKLVSWALVGDILNGHYQYIIYDLIHDKIDLSINSQVKYNFPVGYSANSNRVLSTIRREVKGFSVVDSRKEYLFEGDYRNAVISKSGQFLLLQDEKNVIRIVSIDKNKELYNYELEASDIEIHAIDDNGFVLSFVQWDTENKHYFSSSLFLGFEKGKYEETIIKNLQFSGVSQRNGSTAFLIKGGGVVFNDTLIPFHFTEFPVNVSLNDDASRLFVSLKGGQINIYNTTDLSLEGVMFHPSGKTHILWNKEGDYIANTSLKNYLLPSGLDKSISSYEMLELHNQPQNVMKMFGELNERFYNLLVKSNEIRKSVNSKVLNDISVNSKKPIIDSCLINDDAVTSVTLNQVIQLRFVITPGNSSLSFLQIKHNGVQLNPIKLTQANDFSSEYKITTELILVEGENYLEFTVIDENGVASEKMQRFIVFNTDEPKGDLYFMSVGVSHYKQSQFDLTFADKDAMDLAILYGDTNSIEMDAYENNFFGLRYYVEKFGNQKEKFNEINFYSGMFSSKADLVQVDYSGRYWLQMDISNEEYLWDFKEGTIEKLDLPFDNSVFSFQRSKISPIVDDKGFYFQGTDYQWYEFIFEDLSYSKLLVESEVNFLFSLENNSFLYQVESANYSGGISIVKAFQINNKIELDTFEVKIDTYGILELLAVSPSGEKLLLKINEETWIVKIKNGIQEDYEKININNVAYGSTIYFSKNEQDISILSSTWDEIENITTWTNRVYNFMTKSVYENILNNKTNAYGGLNNINGELSWIMTKDPIANVPNYYSDELSNRSSIQPVSFNKVHTLLLVNESASKEEILRQTNTFLANAKPNDQVVLFLAGHGTLDDDLNYYFAPHNMDFYNPSLHGVSYSQIISMLEKSPAIRKLLLMDTCHSGVIYKKDKGVKSSTPNINNKVDSRGSEEIIFEEENDEEIANILELLFDNIETSTGVTVISASSGVDVALESREMSNGAFTNALMNGIEDQFRIFGTSIDKDKLKKIELDNSYIYTVQKEVISKTQGKQIPNVRELNSINQISLW